MAAYLPEDYVPDVKQRLALYRRLSGRLTPDMVRELEEELLDRFGPLPPEGRNLLGGGAHQTPPAAVGDQASG